MKTPEKAFALGASPRPLGAGLARSGGDVCQRTHGFVASGPLAVGQGDGVAVHLGLRLAAWGGYTVRLILRNPAALAEVENHPSWTHMYLRMMAAQVGFAVAYLV